jgi:hypothetical protein
MPRLRFVTSSQRDSSAPGASSARLINLYSEDVPDSPNSSILRACYGMDLMQQLDGVFIRDLQEVGGFLYAVLPGGFYRLNETGVTLLASTPNGLTGAISRNFDAVTACIGGVLYAHDTLTLATTTPATGLDGGVAWVEFLAGRTICGEIGTGKFAWSDVADPNTFPGLNFAVAEAREDEVIRGMVVGNALYLFGAKTTEVWGVGGSGEGAFLPTGLVIDRGIKAFGLACVADGAIFAVGDDDIAYLASGGQMRAISTPAVNAALAGGEPQTCCFWEERGHKFCAITFRDRPTWVFDVATGRWWERAEGADRAAWRGRVCAKLGADWVTGATDGAIYKLRPILTDAGGVHYREATSSTLEVDGRWFTVAAVEILTGAGFQAGSVMLASGNGIAFGQPRAMPLPAVGEFQARTMFRALGRHQRYAARVSMTDNADIPLYADARVEVA